MTDLSQLVAKNLQVDPNASVDVLVDRLKSNGRLIRINRGNTLAFQTLRRADMLAYT